MQVLNGSYGEPFTDLDKGTTRQTHGGPGEGRDLLPVFYGFEFALADIESVVPADEVDDVLRLALCPLIGALEPNDSAPLAVVGGVAGLAAVREHADLVQPVAMPDHCSVRQARIKQVLRLNEQVRALERERRVVRCLQDALDECVPLA